MTVVAAFDLSLASTGMVAVPLDWSLDWSCVAVAKAGRRCARDAPEDELVDRLYEIGNKVGAFLRDTKATVAVIEQYAFTTQTTHAHAIGELGGVIKVLLRSVGVELVVVSPATCRKLLGKQPRKDAKDWAQIRVWASGAPKTWIGDQVDAFVLANWWLAGNGGAAIALPEGPLPSARPPRPVEELIP